MDKGRILQPFFFILFILLSIYLLTHYQSSKHSELLNDTCFSFGNIKTDIHTNPKSSLNNYYVDYYFFVNQDRYNGVYSIEKNIISKSFFIENFAGHRFPIIYCCNEINNNRLLILPEDFNEFNIPFPDSLNWVKQFIRK